MSDLIFDIMEKNFLTAQEAFESIMEEKKIEALLENTKRIAAARYIDDEEYEIIDEGTGFKIVKARFRGGKLQRRKKVATRPGFTFRNGKMLRMSPSERRNRKMAARRSKVKRRAKAGRANMKRKRTLMKRKSMGL